MSSFYNAYDFLRDVNHALENFDSGCINGVTFSELLHKFIKDFEEYNNVS